jgi:hypothetical protein
METAMKLRTELARVTLRSAVRIAWTLAGAAEALRDTGERLERRVDEHAARRGIDILAVIEPLLQGHVAA